MRRGTVLNLKRLNISNIVLKNKPLIFLIFLFILGVIISSFFSTKYDSVYKMGNSLFVYFKNQHFNLTFFKVFSNSLIFNLVALCVCFTIGTTMLGIVLIPIFIFSVGYLFGNFASYMCITYSLRGIAFNAIVLIPAFIVGTITLIFAAKESISFSLSVSKLTFYAKIHNDLHYNFKNFCFKYSVSIFIMVISSIIDAVFSCSFIKLFNF